MSFTDQKYFLETLLAFKGGEKSFNDLLRELKISPGTLSRRLKDLRKRGLIEPIVVEDEMMKAKYQLTKKGTEIIPLAKKAKKVITDMDEALQK